MADDGKGLIGVEPTYKFVEVEWDEDLVCSICSLPLVSPTTHKPCKNSFCCECVKKLEFQCPSCEGEMGEDSFSPVNQRFVLNILGKVKVECSFCSSVCAISEFEFHKKECEGVVDVCCGKRLGCEYSSQKKDLPSHEKECERAKMAPIFTNLTNRIESLEKKSKEQQTTNKRLRDSLSDQTDEITSLRKRNKTLEETNTTIWKMGGIPNGVSYVEFPLPSDATKEVELFHGFYKLCAKFSCSENGRVSVFVTFVEGPFDEMFPEFPFHGKVIVSILSPKLNPFRSLTLDSGPSPKLEPVKSFTLDSEKSLEVKEFMSMLPSKHGRGWNKRLSLDWVEKHLDGDKLWFSVKVERKLQVEIE